MYELPPSSIVCLPHTCQLAFPLFVSGSCSTASDPDDLSYASRRFITRIVNDALDAHLASTSDIPLEGDSAVLPLRNYALLADGAFPVPELTSLTHGLTESSFLQRVVTRFTHVDCIDPNINLPSVALEPYTDAGECWELDGSSGHLALHLPEPVFISQFSIEHISPALVSNASALRSPRSLKLWGWVDQNALSTHSQSRIRRPPHFGYNGALPDYMHPDGGFIEMGAMEYDLHSGQLRQYQSTSISSAQYVSFSIVLIEFLSNYGAPTTCIYNIGIHGSSSI
ncbi:hypothetical protein ONZ45_g11827 [Pleurotus djamor]|nr:hypothetical protein ONZ45_g11827 [Pleurotus djamor]